MMKVPGLGFLKSDWWSIASRANNELASWIAATRVMAKVVIQRQLASVARHDQGAISWGLQVDVSCFGVYNCWVVS